MASWILFGIFMLIVAINAAICAVKGLNKSMIRLMLIVVAVVLTFLIAAPITNLITDGITLAGESLGELLMDSIGSDDAMESFLDTVPLLFELIMAIPAMLVGLVVFPMVFGLLTLVASIVNRFVQAPLRKLIFKENRTKEENKQLPKKMRMISVYGGLGVGVVTGMIVFGMLFTPFFGLCGILPSAESVEAVFDTMVDQDMMDRSDAEAVQEIYGVTDCAMVKLYTLVGGKATGMAYINATTQIEVNGVTTSLGNELTSILNAAQVLMKSDLLESLNDPEALYELLADEDALEEALKSLFASESLRTSVPDVVAAVMQNVAWSMGVEEDLAEDLASDIRKATKKAISDQEDAEETASTLASVSSTISKAISDATDKDGFVDTSELDYNKIGKAVKKLQKSSLKKVGSCVLDVFAAPDNSGVLSGMLEGIKEDYEDGKDVSGTIPAVVELNNLAVNGVEYFTVDSMNAVYECANSSDAVYNALVEIEENDPFGLEIEDANLRRELADDLYDIFKTTDKTDKDADIIIALGRLLGVEYELLYG